MPTLEVAVDHTILIMCSAGEVRSPYSAAAIQQLEYTTADQEMKPELSVLLVSFICLSNIFYNCEKQGYQGDTSHSSQSVAPAILGCFLYF